MSNPAADLYDLFIKWHDSGGGSAYRQRSIESTEGLEESMLAAQLLEEVERQLNFLHRQGKRVDAYLGAVDAWRRTVFHAPRSWQHDDVYLERIDMLEGLIPLLQDIAAKADELDLNQVREHLDAVEELITDAGDIGTDLQRYISKTLLHLRSLLDEEQAGLAFETGDALSRLAVLLDAAAWRCQDDRRARFAKASEFFRNPFVVGTSAAIVSTTSAAGYRMLGL